MYRIEVQNEINQITSLFHYIGLWHREEELAVREMRLKFFYLMYFMLFPASAFAGAISSDNKDESIFLMETTMILLVLSLKLFYIVQKKREILVLFNEICVYLADDREEFILANDKLKFFVKYVKAFIILTYTSCISASFIVPFLGSDRTLFLNIGFPLDWKNNDIAFWIAFVFILSQTILTMIALLFSFIICLINKSESFFATVFLAQLATSGLCICSSVYSLVFRLSNNLFERMIYVGILFYNIFEIFMVMYLGNEIKLLSDRFSYCLFESDWVDKSESIKKYLIIFGELLKQPQVMVVGKLYPLTLETFTRIIKSAYSMFNILKDMNHN